MSSSTSCWASITAALSTTPTTPDVEHEPSLQEVLLAKGPAATPSRRESIRQLRERADALQRELQAATDQAEAAEAATRHAEGRTGEAADGLHAIARTIRAHDEKLQEMEAELEDRDARIKLLEAILATLTKK